MKTSSMTDAARMSRLFAGNDGAHGTHGAPTRDGLKWEIKATAATVREPPTVELWEKHLSGDRPLGVIPVRADATCSWGSIDVDQYDADLLRIVDAVERGKMPLVPCVSKSGGLHLFMFVQGAAQTTVVMRALQEMSAALGLAGSEVFPKQTRVQPERGEVGNWMVMPYYGGTFGGKLKQQVGLKKTGAEQTIGEFLRTAEAARVTEDALNEMVAAKHAVIHFPGGSGRRPRGDKKTSGAEVSDFSDGPVCLEHLSAIGAPEGGRNNVLMQSGIYYKRKHPGDWQDKLEVFNRGSTLRPPLAAEEVQSAVRSLQKKDYNYLCRLEPMVRHCHSAKCRLRPFGVGEEGRFPQVNSLELLKTDPEKWIVDLDGAHLFLDTKVLFTYTLFQQACMGSGVALFGNMKQSDWVTLLQPAFDSKIITEPPPDMVPGARFYGQLTEMLTDRRSGSQIEDVLAGMTYEDQETGEYCFRIATLRDFLDKKRCKIEDALLSKLLIAVGGRCTEKWLPLRGKKHNLRVWRVPVSFAEKLPELPTPRTEKKDV